MIRNDLQSGPAAPRSPLLDEGPVPVVSTLDSDSDASIPAEAFTLTPLSVDSSPPNGCSAADNRGAELTPFMRQWTTAKRQNPDALLFFRMGDFYELFYDDAAVASRELQLTLTARDSERNVPMCGVPYHAVEQYLTRLLRKGYRIALCDQMEDPKLTKKDRAARGDARSDAGHGARCGTGTGAEQFSGGAV